MVDAGIAVDIATAMLIADAEEVDDRGTTAKRVDDVDDDQG
jgi:hypothetical protein